MVGVSADELWSLLDGCDCNHDRDCNRRGITMTGGTCLGRVLFCPVLRIPYRRSVQRSRLRAWTSKCREERIDFGPCMAICTRYLHLDLRSY